MSLYSETTPTDTDIRYTWARFFGRAIRNAREHKGSIEEVAGHAGMTAAEWNDLEAGQVPTRLEQLRAIAAALDIEWNGMQTLVVFCREAWGL